MGFAFGIFETESGFAVSHQYDRTPSIIRPGDPVTLRVQTVHGYDSVAAYVLDGAGPYGSQTIRDEGTVLPFEHDGGEWSTLLLGSRNNTVQHYIIEAVHRSGTLHFADGNHSLDTAKVFAHRVTDRNPRPGRTMQSSIRSSSTGSQTLTERSANPRSRWVGVAGISMA